MDSLYKISLVPQDMRHEDTLIQVADTFDYLEQIVNEIFSNVERRLAVNKSRVSNLSNRIAKIQKQVEHLSSSTNKATVVFSCTKYPATDTHQPYKSCFPSTTELRQPSKSLKYLFKNHSKCKPKINNDINEKLHFFHVRINDTSQMKLNNNLIQSDQKVHSIPDKVISISDLLFFNSPKNPYYVQLNPYYQQKKILDSRHEQGDNNWISMEAAPESISSRQTLVRREDKNYFYSPNLGDVPTIDVPIDLPDLPGVADDLRYNLELDAAIAPSVITSPILPDLPPLIEETRTESSSAALVHSNDVPDDTTASKETFHELNNSNNCEAPKPPPLPPPPPTFPSPDPPDPEEQFQATALSSPMQTQSVPKPKTSIPSNSGGKELRDSLMEAIRAAGGVQNAKLKSTKNNNKMKESNATKTAPPSGDLMADLHAKLSMRRKGISKGGDTVTTSNPASFISSNAMLTRLSEIIPPPPKTDATDTGTTDNDEEWDD